MNGTPAANKPTQPQVRAENRSNRKSASMNYRPFVRSMHPTLVAQRLIAVSLLTFVAGATATGAEPTANVMLGHRESTRFIQLRDFDFTALLPSPPAAGSIEAAADLETVLQVQATRTAEQIGWAKLIENDNVFLHREILGERFNAETLPATAAFFRALVNDLKAVDAASKLPFKRKRPFQIDSRVKPCVTPPTSSSYPSGSALQALVWAEILGEILPEKRDALIARAHRAAWGRVIGGVHFPTDIEAGRRLAAPFLASCRKSEAFVASLSAARDEITQELRP